MQEASDVLDTSADIALRVGASINMEKLKVFHLSWAESGLRYVRSTFSSRYGPEMTSTEGLATVGISSVMGEKPAALLESFLRA